jgi:hypothetical protein
LTIEIWIVSRFFRGRDSSLASASEHSGKGRNDPYYPELSAQENINIKFAVYEDIQVKILFMPAGQFKIFVGVKYGAGDDGCAARVALGSHGHRKSRRRVVGRRPLWFASHSARSHRLRQAFPAEWPPGSGVSHTVVRQTAPGLRLRIPVTIMEALPQPAGEVPEAAAWTIFSLAQEAQKTGEYAVAVEKFVELRRRYETEARA